MKTADFQLFLKAVPEEDANVSSSRDRKALFMGLIFTLLTGPQKLPPSSVSANQSACTVRTSREEVFCKATLRMPNLKLRLTPGLAPEALPTQPWALTLPSFAPYFPSAQL